MWELRREFYEVVERSYQLSRQQQQLERGDMGCVRNCLVTSPVQPVVRGRDLVIYRLTLSDPYSARMPRRKQTARPAYMGEKTGF